MPNPSSELTSTTARWLVTDAGGELVARITAALDDGRDALAISADGAVRRAAGEPPRVAAALAAAVARRRARERHPDAEQWLFTREALEQASDPAVSAWRARRYLDAFVVDLCSGVGGDAAALLTTARTLATVERDEARAVLAHHNLGVAAAHRADPSGSGVSAAAVRVGVGDALDVAAVRHLDVGTGARSATGGAFRTDDVLVHVDPGRRVGDRRIQDPSLTQPAVDSLMARHQRAAGIGVVLAPGVDADHPALRPPATAALRPPASAARRPPASAAGRPPATAARRPPMTGGTDDQASVSGSLTTDADALDPHVIEVSVTPDRTGADRTADPGVEVEYVQLGSSLVESVAWTGVLRAGPARASATLLARPDGPGPGGGPIHRLVRLGERGPRRPVAPLGTVLVEVAPAAIRARLHDEVGARLGVARVADQRALFSGDDLHLDPWTRSRPILTVTRARAGAVRQWLRDHDVGPVEIVTHGVRVDPSAFWRDIGRPPRGPNGIRIELVRRDTDSVAVITDDAGGHHGW